MVSQIPVVSVPTLGGAPVPQGGSPVPQRVDDSRPIESESLSPRESKQTQWSRLDKPSDSHPDIICLLYESNDSTSVEVHRYALSNKVFTDEQMYQANEENALKLAVGKVLTTLSASEFINANPRSQGYPNNAVLVDFYVRENGKVKIKNSEPETHTICLWHKENKVIRVIDSDGHASENIGSNLNAIQQTIRFGFSYFQKRLYSRVEKIGIGKNLNHYRDCIDIAVKIAYQLGQKSQSLTNVEEIEESLKYLSNIHPKKATDGEIANPCLENMQIRNHQTSMRFLQSSNSENRRMALYILEHGQPFWQHTVFQINKLDTDSIKEVHDFIRGHFKPAEAAFNDRLKNSYVNLIIDISDINNKPKASSNTNSRGNSGTNSRGNSGTATPNKQMSNLKLSSLTTTTS
jgi:hypothetical protein